MGLVATGPHGHRGIDPQGTRLRRDPDRERGENRGIGKHGVRDRGNPSLTSQELAASQDAADQLFSQLITVPGTDSGAGELEEKQLTEALAFYQEKLDEPGGDGQERFRNLLNLAKIQDRLGMGGEATATYDEATKAGNTLLSANPAHPKFDDYTLRLADAEFRRHQLLMEGGRPDPALAALEKSCFLFGKLGERNSLGPEIAHRAARAHLAMAQSCRAAGLLQKASKAAAAVPPVLSDSLDPTSVEHRERQELIAEALFEKSLCARATGEFDEAIATLMQGLDLLLAEARISSSASSDDDRISIDLPGGKAVMVPLTTATQLARIYTELGEIVTFHVQPPDGLTATREATRILGKILKVQPGDPEATIFLARNYGELASHERDAGHLDEALGKQRSALDLLATAADATGASGSDIPVDIAIQTALQNRQLADLLADSKKPDEALRAARLAVTGLRGVVADPARAAGAQMGHDRLRTELGKALGGLGYHAQAADEKDEAVKGFSEALAILERTRQKRSPRGR